MMIKIVSFKIKVTRYKYLNIILNMSNNNNNNNDILLQPIKWYNNDNNNNDNNDDYNNSNKILIPSTNNIINGPIDNNNDNDNDISIIKIPIFPLIDDNAFPTSNLPLNIFVMNYRLMFNDIQKIDGPKVFGICMSKDDKQIVEMGTLCENIEFKSLPDGRQLLNNVCRQRFRVRKIIQYKPYIIAEVEYPIQDLELITNITELSINTCNLEIEVYQALKDVFTLTNTIAKLQKLDGNELEINENLRLLSPQGHPFRLQYCSEFSFAICNMISASPNIKQLLLESESCENRLLILRKLLIYARTQLYEILNEFDNETAFN